MLLTDHDTLGARRDGWEGMHDGVFLLVGVEISPKHGHYLAFGVDEEPPHAGRSAGEIAAAVRAAGGIGFAAHPFSAGGHMLVPPLARRIVLPHGWPALDEPDGADGLELWSLTTDAAEGWRTPAEAWRWLRDPEAAVAPARPRITCGAGMRCRRAAACRRSPAWTATPPASASAAACARRCRTRAPSDCCARTWSPTRALTGDVDLDRETLIGALAAGSAWLAARSSRLRAAPVSGRSAPTARRCRWAGVRVRGARPAGPASEHGGHQVVRDGAPIHKAHAAHLDLDVEGRGYRVEARIAGRLWLISNPIHLR